MSLLAGVNVPDGYAVIVTLVGGELDIRIVTRGPNDGYDCQRLPGVMFAHPADLQSVVDNAVAKLKRGDAARGVPGPVPSALVPIGTTKP